MGTPVSSENLSDNALGKMLLRLQRPAGKFVVRRTPPAEPLADNEQFVLFVNHHTAGADVVGRIERYESGFDQAGASS